MESQTLSNPSFIDPGDHLRDQYGTKEEKTNFAKDRQLLQNIEETVRNIRKIKTNWYLNRTT